MLHALFIHFKDAYDRVRRLKMYQVLTNKGVPAKLIRLIKMNVNKTKNEICGRDEG